MWTPNVRRENLVIKKTAAVYNRHFDSTDFIQGGQRRLKEAAVAVLCVWNTYSSPEDRPSVWERRQ